MPISIQRLAAVSLASLMVLAACGPSSAASTPKGIGGVEVAPQVAAAVSETAAPPKNKDQYLRTQPQVAASSLGGEGSRLEIFSVSRPVGNGDWLEAFSEGKGARLRNGGTVTLGDLNVEVFADPYPPTVINSWLDLYLTKDGQPASGGKVVMEYQMSYMSHGIFKTAAENSGDGHYLFSLGYDMYGTWENLVTIYVGAQKYELPILATVLE